jgi:hypothetical protein
LTKHNGDPRVAVVIVWPDIVGLVGHQHCASGPLPRGTIGLEVIYQRFTSLAPVGVVHEDRFALLVHAVKNYLVGRQLGEFGTDTPAIAGTLFRIRTLLVRFLPSASFPAISFTAFELDAGGGPAIVSTFTSPVGGWSEYTTRPLASVHLYSAAHAGAVAQNVASMMAMATGTADNRRLAFRSLVRSRSKLQRERFIAHLRGNHDLGKVAQRACGRQ